MQHGLCFCLCVYVCVCWKLPWAVLKWRNWSRFRMWTLVGPGNHLLDRGWIPRWNGAIWRWYLGMPRHVRDRCSQSYSLGGRSSARPLAAGLVWKLTTLLRPFNGVFSRTTVASRYQKRRNESGFKWGKRWWGLGMQWLQLDHVQTMCTSLQTDNHTKTSSLSFYRLDALPNYQPTVSKHWRHLVWKLVYSYNKHKH